METKIVSTGSYVPKKQVSNEMLESFMDTNDEWIRTRTGIQQRHLSLNGENTSHLCGEVAKELLEKASVTASEVDLIIVATMTPDYLSPSTACLVQEYIGANQVMAFDVSAACSGFVYALSVADKMMQSGNFRYGLVIGGEVMSKVLDWNDRGTAVLFGDGAGGVLLKAEESPIKKTPLILAEDIHADGSRGLALTVGNLPVANPYQELSEQPVQQLEMEGRKIFDFAIRSVPKSIKQVVENAGLELADIDYILPHQANYRIVEAIAKKLKLPMSMFKTNMDKYGNTSAASIGILLDELITSGELQIGSGQKVILTGFGGGLTWGSLLIQL